MLLRHICEVCGAEEVLAPEEAFARGWDYPPLMGQFGVVSPRTCPNCVISGTLWWALAACAARLDTLTVPQLVTLGRIQGEPESVLP
jgi:hypothetical protein